MHEWLHRIDQYFPVRHTVWLLSGVGTLLFAFTYIAFGVGGAAGLACLFLVGLGWRDTQSQCAPRSSDGPMPLWITKLASSCNSA